MSSSATLTPAMTPVLIVVDLEATCWAPGTPERARQATESEIIELGVALVDPLLGEQTPPLGTFERLVRPLRHPELTEFCAELTGIKSEDLQGAPSLPEALEELWVWLEERLSCPRDRWALTLASWGAFDRGILKREAQERGAWLPEWAHLDVKQSFERFCRRHKRAGASYGLRKAMSSLELADEGPAHRALSDALGAWRVLCACHSPKRLTERAGLLLGELKQGEPVVWSRALPPPLNHKPTFERAAQELTELRLAFMLNHGQGLVLGERLEVMALPSLDLSNTPGVSSASSCSDIIRPRVIDYSLSCVCLIAHSFCELSILTIVYLYLDG